MVRNLGTFTNRLLALLYLRETNYYCKSRSNYTIIYKKAIKLIGGRRKRLESKRGGYLNKRDSH